MNNVDIVLTKRIRDIIAVATDDLDSITYSVEDGVAYIEGVVPSEEERRKIVRAVRKVDGLTRVIVCLATEHVLPQHKSDSSIVAVPATVLMHFHSLS